jgi:hypothetical protein
MGWGALGLGAATIDACGGLPWAKAPLPGADVDRLLADLDHVLLRLESLEPDPALFGIKSREPFVQQGEAMCMRMLTTLCFMGTYRDVPEALWLEPRVEERLAKTLPRIRDTVGSSRNLLADMTDDVAAEIDKKLHDDPGLPMRTMERIDDYAKRARVPIEQRTYLRTATVQLAGRFRYEGTKEVTAKIAAKYARALASRKSELGMDGEGDAEGGGGQQKTQPTPLRVQFHTRSSRLDVHAVTCALESKVKIEGVERPIVLDWDESRCPATSPTKLDNPVHAAVHVEAAEAGENLVTVVLYPPADASGDFTDTVASLGRDIQQRLVARAAGSASALDDERAHFAGRTCATSADCGPLRCIDERCVDPYAPSSTMSRASSRLGSLGESCRSQADCESPLECTRGACKAEDASSAKLIMTTRKVAKWGAILLIPPICAVGVLVLLTCLFMVIVAGCMYAGGD